MVVPVQQVLKPENIFLRNSLDAKADQGLTTSESITQIVNPGILASLHPKMVDQDGTSAVKSKNIKWDGTLRPSPEKNLVFPFINEEPSSAERKVLPNTKEVGMNLDPKIDQKVENGLMKNSFFDETPILFEENGKINLPSNSLGAERGVYQLLSELKGMENIPMDKLGSTVLSVVKNNSPDGPSVLLNQNEHQRIFSGFPSGATKVEEALPVKSGYVEMYQQIGNKVIWGIRNHEDKIKFSMNPPQLGNIYVEINKDKENIKAVLWADHPVTKEILEAHQAELHKILRQDGFNLEKFDVFARQDMGWFHEPKENHVKYGQWTQGQSPEHESSLLQDRSEIGPVAIRASVEGNKSIDVFV